MMLDVAVPVVAGSIIGYVTNWLAIKMLFWPHDPHFVFGLRLPFTPGLFVRRRRDFSASLSDLIEERFVNADQLFRAMQIAEDQGMVGEFVEEMGAVFGLAFRSYINRITVEDFRRDCDRLAKRLCHVHVVSQTVCSAVDTMSSIEIESMIMGIVHRELRGITWVGAVLGASIGLIQVCI